MDPSKPEIFDAKIIAKESPAPGIVTLRLAPVDGRKLEFLQGQFAMLCFPDEPDPKLKCRAYSVSSSATQTDHIDLTIKVVKEWTTRMTSMPVGSVIQLKFPFGHFTLENNDDPVAFIAGGIGVTPFVGMLRWIAASGSKKKAYLFYSAHTQSGLAFKQDLEKLAASCPSIKLCLSVSGSPEEEPGWTGPRGRISSDLMRCNIPDDTSKMKAYICGPNAMIPAMQDALAKAGFAKENIKLESFG